MKAHFILTSAALALSGCAAPMTSYDVAPGTGVSDVCRNLNQEACRQRVLYLGAERLYGSQPIDDAPTVEIITGPIGTAAGACHTATIQPGEIVHLTSSDQRHELFIFPEARRGLLRFWATGRPGAWDRSHKRHDIRVTLHPLDTPDGAVGFHLTPTGWRTITLDAMYRWREATAPSPTGMGNILSEAAHQISLSCSTGRPASPPYSLIFS